MTLDQDIYNRIHTRTGWEHLNFGKDLGQATVRVSTSYYDIHTISKKGGGSREVQAPKFPLKKLQRAILEELNTKFTLSESSTAARGKNFVGNATPHAGAVDVLRVDIKEFYPNCRADELIRQMHLRYPEHTEWFLNHIPFMFYVRRDTFGNRLTGAYDLFLATGAPTSPFLGNLALVPLDEHVLHFLGTYPGATYTRYLDDLTISFKEAVNPEKKNEIRLGIFKIMRDHNWIPHPRKSRWINPTHDRFTVTGVDLRTTPKVTGKYIKQLVKPMIEREVKTLFELNYNLPAFTKKRKAEDIKTFEDIMPIYFGGLLPTLNYIKLVNLQQHQQLIDHLKTRIRRQFELSYGNPIALGKEPQFSQEWALRLRNRNRNFVPYVELGDIKSIQTPEDALIFAVTSLLESRE